MHHFFNTDAVSAVAAAVILSQISRMIMKAICTFDS